MAEGGVVPHLIGRHGGEEAEVGGAHEGKLQSLSLITAYKTHSAVQDHSVRGSLIKSMIKSDKIFFLDFSCLHK